MSLHLAARMHALVHGLFRTSDEVETQTLYQEVETLFNQQGLNTWDDRMQLQDQISTKVASELGIEGSHPQFARIAWLVANLMDDESLLFLPDIDWTEKRKTSQWWEIREFLNVQKGYVKTYADTVYYFTAAVVNLLQLIVEAAPSFLSDPAANHGELTVTTKLLYSLGNPGSVFDRLLDTIFSKELSERGLFKHLRSQLEYNLIVASGGNPAEPQTFSRQPVFPSKSIIKDIVALTETYWAETPILGLLDETINFVVPTASRFEHTHIVAGTGHGKTQTLQYLICQDLPAVARGERSIIVLDSQGDLIQNIAHFAEFAPGGPLEDRIVLIDPSDVEWPVSLNLFDVGIERLQQYELLERERLTNSILELYDFVLGTLLSAEMTQKQNVIFRYVTRLMLYIPDATIHTLRELMEPDSHLKFAAHIDKLSGTARQFFQTEFKDREFSQTKKQVLRRLWGILENQTFERMFSHPRSKLDLYKEMNSGKVILINTAKDLLKEQGSEIFGRFFIALVAQAAQERATLPEAERLPTFVYIDEAADYFDRNIGIILAQARKYKVGMVLAHQYLGQLDSKLQDAFAANTAIKFAGGVSNKDARILAPMLHSDPELIEKLPKGNFVTYIRGQTPSAVPLSFPLGYLEQKPQMSSEAWQKLRELMRSRYAVHYTELEAKGEDEAINTEKEEVEPAAKKKPSGPDEVDTTPGSEW